MMYKGTLIAVKDMEKSKKFYFDILGLEVVGDFGANVMLSGGLSLQTAESWIKFIRKTENEIIYKNNAMELYFEVEDIDDFANKLSSFSEISYLHQILEHSWGQRAVRFYDPDGHIIEVAENIISVVRRFVESGFTAEETAVRMDVPVDYVKSCLI